MPFTQEDIFRNIVISTSEIEKEQQKLNRMREGFRDFLEGHGYLFVDGYYVHPDYLEEWKVFVKYGGYGHEIPSGKVVKCPVSNEF